MKFMLRELEVLDAVAIVDSLSSTASSVIDELQSVHGRSLFAHGKGGALQITDEGKRMRSMVRSMPGRI